MNGPVVYRLRGEDGSLLYIGSTGNLKYRLAQHKADKAWWPDVAHVDAEHFDTRAEAGEAEIKAIVSEKPIHNQRNRWADMTLRNFRVKEPLWQAAKAKAAEEGTTISDHIREALTNWTTDKGKK